jgi:predicted ATPase
MRGRSTTRLRAPFLKRVSLLDTAAAAGDGYPFSLPFVTQRALDISFTKPVTIIVGENGSGKSTFLEALATGCGFNLAGGSANNRFGDEKKSPLAAHLRFSWLPKVSRGFFMRAESFFNFASHIDELAREDGGATLPYGGQSLHQRSHGEAFLALFENRFGRDGLYILDEPEAALSPSRQLIFLRIIHELERRNCQVIMATHAPLIMAYPTATLLKLEDGRFAETDLRSTSHYLVLREFMKDPGRFMADLLGPEGAG